MKVPHGLVPNDDQKIKRKSNSIKESQFLYLRISLPRTVVSVCYVIYVCSKMDGKLLLFVSIVMLIGPAHAVHWNNLTFTPAAERNLEQESKNKEIVLKFYQELVGDKDPSAIDRYVDPNEYIQHNPTVPDGPEGLRKKAFGPGGWWKEGQNKHIVDFRRAVAEDDYVWIHLRDTYDGKLSALIDIFRLRDGKIVEHWDVIQPIPISAANQRPMFNSEIDEFEQECGFRKKILYR